MAGMTMKQAGRERFWKALDGYKAALRDGKDIVRASLEVHMARGADGVPKSWGKYVRQAFREAGREGSCTA